MKGIVISGGTSGIGLAVAKKIALRGEIPILLGRDAERGQAALREVPEARFIPCDVADTEMLMGAVEQARAQADIAGLVTSAGQYRECLLSEETCTTMEQLFAVNVYGSIELCRLLAPDLQRQHGAAVLVASDAARNGNVAASIYAATKGAITAFARSWALEMAVHGVRVNAVLPGDVDTPLTHAQDVNVQELGAHYPLGRIAQSSEVAAVIDFLLHEEASFVTGAWWSVDGGLTAW